MIVWGCGGRCRGKKRGGIRKINTRRRKRSGKTERKKRNNIYEQEKLKREDVERRCIKDYKENECRLSKVEEHRKQRKSKENCR
jgi:hypothetical protein